MNGCTATVRFVAILAGGCAAGEAVADLPWTTERRRRFYGFGESRDGAGVTIFALRMRDHMQLTASFDARSAEPAAVRAALADLAQPAEVLSPGR